MNENLNNFCLSSYIHIWILWAFRWWTWKLIMGTCGRRQWELTVWRLRCLRLWREWTLNDTLLDLARPRYLNRNGSLLLFGEQERKIKCQFLFTINSSRTSSANWYKPVAVEIVVVAPVVIQRPCDRAPFDAVVLGIDHQYLLGICFDGNKMFSLKLTFASTMKCHGREMNTHTHKQNLTV